MHSKNLCKRLNNIYLGTNWYSNFNLFYYIYYKGDEADAMYIIKFGEFKLQQKIKFANNLHD